MNNPLKHPLGKLPKPAWLPTISQWFKRVFAATASTPEPSESDTSSIVQEQEQSQLVPYDENLLERSRTQWQFGDWETLAKLDRDTLQHHPDRAKLALLAAAGHQQQGNMEQTRQFTRLAQDWGCGKKLISQVLIAGVYNTLGKASAIAGQEQRALGHFEESVRTANSGGDVRLLTQARIQHQSRISGIHWKNQLIAGTSARHERGLHRTFPFTTSPLSPSQPPSDIYEALALLHDQFNPSLYLEIGVHDGKTLALAKGMAIGVDPVPRVTVKLPENAKVVQASSDEFFAGLADSFLKRPVDLVFMNGMPLLDYVLRDFINIEQRATTSTVVAVTNIYPKYASQATPRRTGTDWIGDVWKLPQVLAKYRQDLQTICLDIDDYGLLLVTGLDPENTVLGQKQAEIMQSQREIAEPPETVMNKKGAVTWNDPRVAMFFQP